MRLFRFLPGGRRRKPPAPPVHRRRPRGRVSNHCDLSSPREAPEDLLRELRNVDPLYDIHYLGEGSWVIGRVVHNAERGKIGGKIKRRRMRQKVRATFAEIALPELVYQGFGAVALFQFSGEPDWRIVADAREREWLYRNRGRAEFEERLNRSEGIAEVAGVPTHMGSDAWWDEIRYRELNVAPQLFRGAKTFRFGASA